MASTDPTLPLRLTLLCCAGTAMARRGGFATAEESLDEAGRAHTAGMRIEGPASATVLASPAQAALQTAAAMGLEAAIVPALADMDWGAWAGCLFAEVSGNAPAQLAAWIANPSRGAPGGETFAAVTERAARWLEKLDTTAGPILAITHPMTIRAILAAALAIPAEAAFRIDFAPLAQIVLSFNRGWRLQEIRAR